MSTEMNRRSFVGFAMAAITAAYVPKEIAKTVARITAPISTSPHTTVEPIGTNPHIFQVEAAEWFRPIDNFSTQAFRIRGRFPDNPKVGELYAVAAVEDLVLISAKSSRVVIQAMLENMEQGIRKYDPKAVIVYSGELKEAIESKGVHLES